MRNTTAAGGLKRCMRNFKRSCGSTWARYPLMEPQDCAKLAYQSTFGPAHAAGERGDVLRQLLGECSALPADREARAAGADRERFVPRSFVGDGGLDAGCARSWRIYCF